LLISLYNRNVGMFGHPAIHVARGHGSAAIYQPFRQRTGVAAYVEDRATDNVAEHAHVPGHA
jgi:hypothetical protein